MGGIATIVAAAVSAAGTYANSRAQSSSAKFQEQASKDNAALAEINAQIAQSEAKREQALSAENAYQAKGRMRAALAESGTLESTSSLLLMDQADAQAQEEQGRIARAGEMESLNHRIQKSNALNSASISSMNSKASRTGGIIGALGTLIGGASSTYDHQRKYHNK